MPESNRSIGEKLIKAGRLSHRIIGVYAVDKKPAASVTTASIINRDTPCLAKALFKMASRRDIPAVYIGADAAEGSCSGAMGLFGFTGFPPNVENMFSSDAPSGSMCIKKAPQSAKPRFAIWAPARLPARMWSCRRWMK